MKTTRKILVVLILLLPVLLLTSCEDADWDLLEIAFESWAEENGLVEDGAWQPDGVVVKAVEDKVAEITNQNAAVQLDGVNAVRDMEKATELADEAMLDLDIAKMSSAVSLRPNDWRLHEQEGVVWLANANGAAAQTAFTNADELLLESLQSGGDCFAMRRTQLENRMFALSDALAAVRLENPGGPAFEVLQVENRRVADELSMMSTSQQSDFCE
jgi:hypothetical protein